MPGCGRGFYKIKTRFAVQIDAGCSLRFYSRTSLTARTTPNEIRISVTPLNVGRQLYNDEPIGSHDKYQLSVMIVFFLTIPLPCQVFYSVFLSSTFISCDFQILEDIFPNYFFQEFQLSFSDSKTKYFFFFSIFLKYRHICSVFIILLQSHNIC